MSKTKKIILVVAATLTLLIGAGCVFALSVVHQAKKTTDNIYESAERASTRDDSDKPVNFEATEPFSVLLLGVDSGGLGRSDQGRSDTMMVVTVNPQQKKSTIVSIDRDIYTQIVGHGTYDKLNHAYAFGGVGMAMDSVEALLDIPINHYVTINLDGFSDLVDAVGGIDVTNKYHFELDGVELLPGDYHLDGKQALSYARYRKYNATTGMGDPDGDIGRQQRQRDVVKEIVNKILSLNSITSYQDILKAVEKNTKTDLVWNDMLNIVEGYTSAAKDVESLQLQGDGVMMDSIYYQKVHQDSLLEIQNKLKTQLNLPTSDALDLSKYADNQFYGSSNETTTTESSEEVTATSTTSEEVYYDDEEEETNDNSWSNSNSGSSNNSGSTGGNGGTTTPSSDNGGGTSSESSTSSTPSESGNAGESSSSSSEESTTPSTSAPEETTESTTPVEPTTSGE